MPHGITTAKQGEQITITLASSGVVLTVTGPEEVRVALAAPATAAETNGAGAVPSNDQGLPQPVGFTWQEPLHPGVEFNFRFPEAEEHFTHVREARITLLNKTYHVRIGRTERHGRGRLIVFFGREILVEFFETADSQGFASLIRPDGKKTLRPGDPPPTLYQQARLEHYREAIGMSGKGFPKSMALVIGKDDLASAVYHAAARWLAERGYPVEPAE